MSKAYFISLISSYLFLISSITRLLVVIVITLLPISIFANNTASITVANNLDNNLWHYIDDNAKLEFDVSYVVDYIDWFKNNPGYLQRISVRAKLYLYFIVKEVEARNMPIEIALLPVVESAFYPFAYSSGAASGLWQFIPSTGLIYGLDQNWWYDARRDISASTNSALQYLQNLYILFDNDWLLAIAAYNAGPGRVKKAIKKNKRLGLATDFWSLDLPLETKDYVPKLLAVREIIRNQGKYNQQLSLVKNEQVIDSLVLKSQLNIKKISDLSGVGINEIYNLNPGIKRWTTPPIDNYKLLLPISVISKFKKKLATLPLASQLEWVRHKVLDGEKLLDIANTYGVSENNLANINNLDNTITRSGDFIIVPILKQYYSYHSLSEKQQKQRLEQQKYKTDINHKVVVGDSLWKIAKLYQVSIAYLMEKNNITKAHFIRVGDNLIIKNKYDIKQALVDNDITTKISIIRKILYNIRKNDTLSQIAYKFNVSIDNIKKWNNLDSDIIKYGANLILYISMVQ